MENIILQILRENARTPISQIAARLGKPEHEIAAALKKFEDDKVILGYQAIVDPEKSENGLVIAIIEVKLTPQRGTGFDAIARRIYKFPEVKVCYLISGDYDLHVVVEGNSLKEVASFVSERLATIDHVSSTATHFILKKYKDFGVALQGGDDDDRLPVTP